MGTRGVLGFVVNGEEKIGYQQFDSYPSGVGLDTLRWLREAVANPEGLLAQALALKVVSEDTPPTAEEIEALREFADFGVSTGQITEWYVLLRETQGRADEILRAGYVEDSSDFVVDSLFCEWGYIVDLDRLTFEVYRGFHGKSGKQPHSEGRFAARGVHESHVGSYYPIRLVASWPLHQLPTDDDFLKLEEAEEAEEASVG